MLDLHAASELIQREVLVSMFERCPGSTRAYLSFGATDSLCRRRGSQGALMAARIQAAIDAGCKHLFTETGEAVEGDRQTSYGNIVRYGFTPTVLCENWTVRQRAQSAP